MNDHRLSQPLELPQLNQRFRQPSVFDDCGTQYQLLPFDFRRISGPYSGPELTGAHLADRVLLTNMAGEHTVISGADLQALVNRTFQIAPDVLNRLQAKGFVSAPGKSVAIELLAQGIRSKLSTVMSGTALHLFVVTLRCDHSCPYCQVSRVSDDCMAYDMSVEQAEAGLRVMFESPSPVLKLEIQGGEPLLNFGLVQHIIKRAREIAKHDHRNLDCVIATNLANVTPEMCLFFREHNVQISTSIDGPQDLHNTNRPRPGRDAFERAVAGINLVRNICGVDAVTALPTTTKASLGRVREIVDLYVELGMDGIFLRPLSPFGFAVKTRRAIGYETEDFFRHFVEGAEYCIELHKRGYPFREFYSSIMLRRMLTPFDTGYVDLMNPAGIGLSVLVFNYDGRVYVSDEARMLAEVGDQTFCLGDVVGASRAGLLSKPEFARWLEGSMAEGIPGCSWCAFRPWCGTDPVFHHATQGSVTGVRAWSAFCKRNMATFDWLVKKLDRADDDARVLRAWAGMP